MSNIFDTYPIVVNDLDRNGNIKCRYIFVGNVSEKIIHELESYVRNKKYNNQELIKHYGPKWKQSLEGGHDTTTGGDPAQILLDEDDLLELGVKPGHKPTVRPPERPTTPTHTSSSHTTTRIITNVHFYPEDRVSEFKEKISIAIHGAAMFKQHLYAKGYDPLSYRIISDMVVDTNIESLWGGGVSLTNRGSSVLGFPVDENLYRSKDAIQVEAFDYFVTLGELYNKHNIRHYNLVNIDEFLSGQESSLREISKSDPYQFQLIYYSFIIRFWPMLTLDAFKLYLNNENDFRETYPDLSLSPDSLKKKYMLEMSILDKKYELLRNRPGDFMKFAPSQATLSSPPSRDKVIDVSVKGATLIIEKEISWKVFDISLFTKINMRNLFELLHADNDIPLIRANISGIIYTKTKSPTLVENNPKDIARIYEKIKYRIQLPIMNSILLVVPISADSIARKIDNLYLILIIYDNGKYFVKTSWGEEIQMGFDNMYKLMESQINPIITKINKYGRGIFDSVHKLQHIRKESAKFSGLYLSLFWKTTITATNFSMLGQLLKHDADSGIIKQSESYVANTFDYNMIKGMTEYDMADLEQNIYAQNYYEYLTNAKIKQRWNQLFLSGRSIKFILRTTDVKIEVQDLREKEFSYFYEYIISLLYRLEVDIRGQRNGPHSRNGRANDRMNELDGPRGDRSGHRHSNRLKVLKSKDPELFIFKRFGSDVVYSRVCQKENQPLIYDTAEFESMSESEKKKMTKLWNYTTNQAAFYKCPDPEYPYLNLMMGRHPRGYGLPCCKKTPHDPSATSDENDSRYIMNYGKPIEVGRIGKLPDIMDKYLLYNLEDKEILLEEQTPKIFIHEGTKYNVPLLMKITKHSKVKVMFLNELNFFMNVPMKNFHISTSEKSPGQIIKNSELSPIDFNKISNSDVAVPILVLREDEPSQKLHLIEGIFRLAKAFLVGDTQINVKIITKYQLMKAQMGMNGGMDGVIGGSCGCLGSGLAGPIGVSVMRKPAYYLFGVPQNNMEISNIGAGHAIASALNMSFPEMIEKFIKFFSGYDGELNFFSILYRGSLGLFFGSLTNLLDHMKELFVEESTDLLEDDRSLKKFSGWNELFVEMTEICFNKRTFLLDDTSIDVTGTSIKANKIIENIELILSDFQDIDLLIPEATATGVHEFILLLRKKKKSKVLFSENYIYYPIFLFVPQEFFKSGRAEKKIFTNRDEIMKLLKKVIIDSMKKMPKEENNFINIDVLKLFIKYSSLGVSIKNYFINNRSLCYAVELEFGKKKHRLIWPIHQSIVEKVDNMKYPSQHYKIDNVTATFADAKELFEDYNKFIIQESENRGLYQISPEETEYASDWNRREKTILPVYPLVRVDKFLSYDTRIIGFMSRGFYYYFEAVENKSYPNVIKKFLSGYSLLVEGFTKLPIKRSIFYILYDPDDVNKTIAEVDVGQEDSSGRPCGFSELGQVLYKKYIYDLFVIEIINYLDHERNNEVRSKISRLIRTIDFRKVQELDKFKKNIDELITFENDNFKLQSYIASGSKDIMSKIESDVFDFDKITIGKWKKLIEADRQDELLASVKKISAKVIKIVPASQLAAALRGGNGSSGSGDPIFPNVFVPCGESHSSYCSGQHLMVLREDYPLLVDLFVSDLMNPLKREYILSLIILRNTQDNFIFTKKKGEEIYISS